MKSDDTPVVWLDLQFGEISDAVQRLCLDEQELRHLIGCAITGLREEVELNVRVVDKAESQRLNARYRSVERATNVLAFPVEGLEEIAHAFIGDVVVCGPVVEQEARQQNKSFAAHFSHLVVHAVLHLLGYDHQDQDEAEVMELREREVLSMLGIEDPYKERTGPAAR